MGVAVLAALVGLGVTFALRRTRTVYCAETVDAIDGPRCVHVIPKAAEARRGTAWTIAMTASGGRLTQVRYENFAGRFAVYLAFAERAYERELVYGERGTLREVDSRDASGFLFARERMSEGGRVVDITGDDGEPAGLSNHGPRVTRIRREFDSRGFVMKETFFGPTGKPRADAVGAYGYALALGPTGMVTRRTVLGSDGAPGVDEAGRAFVDTVYDDASRTMTLRRFGSDGQPRPLSPALTPSRPCRTATTRRSKRPTSTFTTRPSRPATYRGCAGVPGAVDRRETGE